jgi:hypothetical protein
MITYLAISVKGACLKNVDDVFPNEVTGVGILERQV